MGIKDDMQDVQEAVINELITENGITNTLADGQVTETKIANGAVTAAKLGSDVSLTVADGSITPAKLDRAYLESTGGSVSGNVGIGTSSPNSYANYHVLTLNGTNGGVLDLESNGNLTGQIYVGTNQLIMDAVGSSSIFRFQTNSSERMRIQADGTIKISNSSTPSTPSGGGVLYVQNGALKFRGSSGTVTTIANA